MPERKGKREERASFRGNEFDLATMRDERRAVLTTSKLGSGRLTATRRNAFGIVLGSPVSVSSIRLRQRKEPGHLDQATIGPLQICARLLASPCIRNRDFAVPESKAENGSQGVSWRKMAKPGVSRRASK